LGEEPREKEFKIVVLKLYKLELDITDSGRIGRVDIIDNTYEGRFKPKTMNYGLPRKRQQRTASPAGGSGQNPL
jgi:hypothetical protein